MLYWRYTKRETSRLHHDKYSVVSFVENKKPSDLLFCYIQMVTHVQTWAFVPSEGGKNGVRFIELRWCRSDTVLILEHVFVGLALILKEQREVDMLLSWTCFCLGVFRVWGWGGGDRGESPLPWRCCRGVCSLLRPGGLVRILLIKILPVNILCSVYIRCESWLYVGPKMTHDKLR